MTHEASCFVTLTYAPEFLPADGSISKRHLQLFHKRANHHLGGGLRFFGVGEYGSEGNRPHYHTIMFGVWFSDAYPWRTTPAGHMLYRSATLESLWPFGAAEFGMVTPESAAYVARYTMKKINGAAESDQYRRVAIVPETGELRTWHVMPEFALMSRRPGIGSEWFNRFASDAFPSDFITINGVKRPVPRFYLLKLAEADQAKIVRQRKANAKRHADNNTEARLLTRHKSQALRAKLLVRSYEAGQ
jgi:hypothetical protein